MSKRLLSGLLVCLMAASVAQAQSTGDHGNRGDRGDRGSSRSGPSQQGPATVDKIVIVGVVRAIDLPAARITIAYEPVDALDWPKGTMPFAVSKPDLLNGVTVGEKVSFRLESQQIYDLKAYTPPPPPEY